MYLRPVLFFPYGPSGPMTYWSFCFKSLRIFKIMSFICNLRTSIGNGEYWELPIISKESIYTIAVAEKQFFKKIINIDPTIEVFKKNGIPFIIDVSSKLEKPISISHHGIFWEGITIWWVSARIKKTFFFVCKIVTFDACCNFNYINYII